MEKKFENHDITFHVNMNQRTHLVIVSYLGYCLLHLMSFPL